jgi:hypothetical protein
MSEKFFEINKLKPVFDKYAFYTVVQAKEFSKAYYESLTNKTEISTNKELRELLVKELCIDTARVLDREALYKIAQRRIQLALKHWKNDNQYQDESQNKIIAKADVDVSYAKALKDEYANFIKNQEELFKEGKIPKMFTIFSALELQGGKVRNKGKDPVADRDGMTISIWILRNIFKMNLKQKNPTPREIEQKLTAYGLICNLLNFSSHKEPTKAWREHNAILKYYEDYDNFDHLDYFNECFKHYYKDFND